MLWQISVIENCKMDILKGEKSEKHYRREELQVYSRSWERDHVAEQVNKRASGIKQG